MLMQVVEGLAALALLLLAGVMFGGRDLAVLRTCETVEPLPWTGTVHKVP